MNINEYISSGILEQYVIGMLTEEERLVVEKNAEQYPEIRAELDAIELAMERYAKMHELQKPAGLEAKFNQRIDELEGKATPSTPKPTKPNDKKSGGFLLPILLTLALAAAGWWGYSNLKKYQNTEQQLSDTTNQFNTLQEDCNETKEAIKILQDRLNILQNPDNQTIKIPIIESGEQYASVIWNPQTQKSYLFNTSKLPPPPTGKQYQLWAIVNGVPQNMQAISIASYPESMVEISFIENSIAFAISLEDEGTSPTTPTLVLGAGTLG